MGFSRFLQLFGAKIMPMNWFGSLFFKIIVVITLSLPCAVSAAEIEPMYIEAQLDQGVAKQFEIKITADTVGLVEASIDLYLDSNNLSSDASIAKWFKFPKTVVIKEGQGGFFIAFTPLKKFKGEIDATLLLKFKEKNLPLFQIKRIPISLVVGRDANPRAAVLRKVSSESLDIFKAGDRIIYSVENNSPFSKDISLKFELIKKGSSAKGKIFFSETQTISLGPSHKELFYFSLPLVVETSEFSNLVTLMVDSVITARTSKRIIIGPRSLIGSHRQIENKRNITSMLEITPGKSKLISFPIVNNGLYPLEYSFNNFSSLSLSESTPNDPRRIYLEFLFDKVLVLPNTSKEMIARVRWDQKTTVPYNRVRVPLSGRKISDYTEVEFDYFLDLVLINSEGAQDKSILFHEWKLIDNESGYEVEALVENIGSIPLNDDYIFSITIKNSELKVVEVKKIKLENILMPTDKTLINFGLRDGLGLDRYMFEVVSRNEGLKVKVKSGFSTYKDQ